MNVPSEQPLLAVEWWDAYFAENGGWEKNRGRLQTRLFADAFCRHSTLDHLGRYTFLDSSCALGDAMPILHAHFPNATLIGQDFSEVAVRRSRERFGHLAEFRVQSLFELDQFYDVIYSSATLEHFIHAEDIARHLLAHCRHLAILVPFNEQRNGLDLERFPPEQDHVRTFRPRSFDFLVQDGLASRVHPPSIFRVPGAWSWTLSQRLVATAKNIVRIALGRPLAWERRMMLVEIENASGAPPSSSPPADDAQRLRTTEQVGV